MDKSHKVFKSNGDIYIRSSFISYFVRFFFKTVVSIWDLAFCFSTWLFIIECSSASFVWFDETHIRAKCFILCCSVRWCFCWLRFRYFCLHQAYCTSVVTLQPHRRGESPPPLQNHCRKNDLHKINISAIYFGRILWFIVSSGCLAFGMAYIRNESVSVFACFSFLDGWSIGFRDAW